MGTPSVSAPNPPAERGRGPCSPWLAFLFIALAIPVFGSDADFATVKRTHAQSDAHLYDRHGELLQELRVDKQRRALEWVELKDISPALIEAVVAAEDHRFFDHGGVDWRALARAGWSALRGDTRRGASTLSMQLAARLDAGGSAAGRRGVGEKWDQIRAARALEAHWSKAEILEAYLNLVDFRGELRGVAAAARGLFDKHPSGLDRTEALILAALLRAPAATPDVAAARACVLGEHMQAAIACDTIAARAAESLRGPYRVRPLAADAPQVARRLLKERKRATTTLDAHLQRFARAVLAHQLDLLGHERLGDGAVLVVENKTGEVIAYVGNRGDSHVDGVQAPRQAGSTLKPFLYGLAIEKRLLTAASVLDDSPLQLAAPTGLYVPQNYEKDFKGPVSVRTSLGSSLNIPAVRAIILVGPDAFVLRLRQLGLSYLNQDGGYYGSALALGSAEVNLWQLVNAYRTLANSGSYSPLTLERVTARRPVHVFDADAAFIISDILSDRSARSLTFGFENVLATPFWSAVKTGTSKDMRDNWCVGYSDRYTVGVWVGNFDGAPMKDVSGVTGAAPVWLEVMRALHAGRPRYAPTPPAGVVASDIVFTPAIESARREWFLTGTAVHDVRMADRRDAMPTRIYYPKSGTILALDPDIPTERQRVFFEVVPPADAPRLALDGNLVAARAAWLPTPGNHLLTLFNDAGGVVDEVTFEVRGSALVDRPLQSDATPVARPTEIPR